MEIEGYRAVIQFDPDIDMFRGEFVGLNGGADFHARDVAGLGREGAASLKVFLEMCEEDGAEPRRQFSGRFNVRLLPELHADIAAAAAAHGKSLNQWITDESKGPPPTMSASGGRSSRRSNSSVVPTASPVAQQDRHPGMPRTREGDLPSMPTPGAGILQTDIVGQLL